MSEIKVVRKKVVLPCKAKAFTRTGNEIQTYAYCRIELREKKDFPELSIGGVIGPLPSGNCRGSAGQCVDEIRKGVPYGSWTGEMLEKFCDIWDRWHLNCMRPYCEHQKELGWDDIAAEKVKIYHYKLKSEWISKKREIRDSAMKLLLSGQGVKLDGKRRFIANLDYSITTWEEKESKYYEPDTASFHSGFVEEKLKGWTKPEEHPLGILCKPCPVCGYKYGSEWRKEKVPEDVIEWLFALPDVEGPHPAWI